MRRFRRSRSGRRGMSRPVRNREWIGFTTGGEYLEPETLILTAGDIFPAWVIDPPTAKTRWDEPTIVRLLLIPQVYVNATPTEATGDYRLTLRGGFLTWKSTSTTGLVIPSDLDGIDPSDPSADWLWWTESHFRHFNAKAYGTNVHDFTGQGGFIDIRSKRKMELGYGLAGCFEVLADSTPGGANFLGVSFHMAGRILLLNH